MKSTKFLITSICIIIMTLVFSCREGQKTSDKNDENLWPEVNSTTKPWTRWWWLGNAVDKENISRRLSEFASAGIGGVEITPIYGVKGYEDEFIKYLSPEWMEMLSFTIDEADKLGLGVDMILGTGWPFGGPQVENKYAARKIHIRSYQVRKGEKFNKKLKIEDPDEDERAYVEYLYAFGPAGNKKDITKLLDGDHLKWTPDDNYQIFAIFRGRTGQQVKRAAPGGEGNVLDHFSSKALLDYLEPYNEKLSPVKDKLRAIFNDSYEVYDADYTTDFFSEFYKRRGYDLTDHLPVLAENPSSEEALRIFSDYRETLSDLVLHDFSENWVKWAHENGFLTKYQAHGCPGNLLDIYATADIPECESFYGTKFDIPGVRWEESDALQAYPDLILLKFASSAANISGKDLTSSETFTWLREHFKTALSQCKPELEQIFLSGVNHVFFHGSTYYPDEAAWPGWKFYASVNFVPNNTIWKDAPYMFNYISRCQSMLQSGASDNEILIYWPFHDVIAKDRKGEILLQLAINNKEEWLTETPFYKIAQNLIDKGYSVDFVSDHFIENTLVSNENIELNNSKYKALIVPDTKHMPHETLKTIYSIDKTGGNVIFEGLPETVPGYHNYKEREEEMLELMNNIQNDLVVSDDILSKLKEEEIMPEEFKEHGLDFIRREAGDGKIYFIVNHSPDSFDHYISLNTRSRSVLIMDPLDGRSGKGKSKIRNNKTEVLIQLKSGESIILRTFDENQNIPEWAYYEETGNPYELEGSWKLKFLSGGPEIPDEHYLNVLKSWTKLGDEEAAFSGTAHYELEFENPDPSVKHWAIDLGDVRESARVWINDDYKGCFWSVPFFGEIGQLEEETNKIQIEVTNLSANRLRDLELRGVEWKNFYEINMVNRHYTEFDATTWEPMPSGLLSTVKLQALKEK